MNRFVPRHRSGAFSESDSDFPLCTSPSDVERFQALISLEAERGLEQRLVVVSNRLPVTVMKDEQGVYSMRKSTGGLASALHACDNMHMTLVGWPGVEVPEDQQDKVSLGLYREHNCIPVYLSQEEIDMYYNGFSNGVLWPLFHYVAPGSISKSYESEWRSYESVNRKFVECVANLIFDSPTTPTVSYASSTPPLLVWVHDYHLMLVPRYLRELVPEAKIGWFLHTPFPTFELFRMLPYRVSLLEGVLASDYIAFQIADYCDHFLSTCRRLTDLSVSGNIVDATSIEGPSVVRIDTVPIGIDPKPFVDATKELPTLMESTVTLPSSLADSMTQIREQFGNKKIILGVDRLDYMKGIQHKLLAYEAFLTKYPEWKNECVLVQLAVPSRSACKEYQRLRKHVHELVGGICGKHCDIGQKVPPVVYLDKSVDFNDLAALYRSADVMLITSIRDGMNLVAFEYVASQRGRYGVLVLSEFAGAINPMREGVLPINPWDIEGTSDAIKVALEMPFQDRMNRHEFCFNYVNTFTANRWASTFLDNLTHQGELAEDRHSVIRLSQNTSIPLSK